MNELNVVGIVRMQRVKESKERREEMSLLRVAHHAVRVMAFLGASLPLWLYFLVLVFFISGGFPLTAYGMGGDITGQLRDAKTGQQLPVAATADSHGNVVIAGSQNLTGVSQFYTIKISTISPGAPTVAWTSTLGRCSNAVSAICSADADCGAGSCNVAPPSPGDQIGAVATDAADNVIVAGHVNNGTNFQCEVIKYNASDGSVLWKQTYPASPTSNTYCDSIAVEKGGVCSGSVCSNHGGRACSSDADCNDIYVGGHTGPQGQENFLILGYTPAGLLDTGFNSSGVLIYDATPLGKDVLTSLVWTADGAVAAAGYSQRGICSLDSSTNCSSDADCQSSGKGTCNLSNFDCFTAKIGADGSVQWTQRYPGAGTGGDDSRRIIKADAQGNVVVTGNVMNSTGSTDIRTMKYNGTNGTLIGSWTYSSGYDNVPKDMLIDNAGDIYITGYATNPDSSNRFYAARYNGASGTGAKVWETIGLGLGNSNSATASGIVLDSSGDVFVMGYEYNASTAGFDWLTAKYKGTNGNLLWQTAFDGAAHKNDEAVGAVFSMTCTNAPNTVCATDADCASPGTCGNLYVAGWSDAWTNSAQDYDYYLINYDRGLLNPPTDLTASAGVCPDNITGCTQDSDCGGAAGSCAATKIRLSWQDNSTNETDFVIERKLGEFGTYAVAATVSAGASSYTDTDPSLTANTNYYYRVRAHNSSIGLYSNYSNEANALTTVVSFSAPAGIYLYDNASAYVCYDSSSDTITTTACKKNIDCTNAGISGYCITDRANEVATAITASTDDNPVATGYRASYLLSYEWYTTKLNRSDMSLIWSGTYGDVDREYEAACIAGDNNGNTLVSGYAEVQGAGGLVYLHQISTLNYSGAYPSSGSMTLWESQFNNPFQQNVDPVAIATSIDGSNNVAVAGYGKNKVCSNNSSTVCYQDSDCGSGNTCVTGNEGIYVIKYLSGGQCAISQGTSCLSDADCQFPDYCTSLSNWISRYDGPGQGNDRPSSVAFDQDGNVFVAGYVRDGTLNQDDFFIAKYCGSNACSGNSNKACGRDTDCSQALLEGTCSGTYSKCGGKSKGQTIWSGIYSGTGNGNNHATSLAVDNYGNVYTSGFVKAQCADPSFTTQSDCASALCCNGAPYSTQGACEAAGGTWGSCAWNAVADEDWCTTKYSGSTGQVLWRSFYDGPAHGDDEAKAVKVDPVDGNVVVAGTSLVSSGTCAGSPSTCSNYPAKTCSTSSDCDSHDFHVVRYAASDGSVIWENDFRSRSSDDALVGSMAMDSSGYIYVAGDAYNGSNLDIMSVIYDYAQGNVLDAMMFDGARCSNDYTKLCTAATQSADCGSGNTCLTGLTGSAGGDDVANAIAVNNRGEAFIAGYSMNPYLNQDFLVLKQKNSYVMPTPAPFTVVAATTYSNNYNVNLTWHNNTKLCYNGSAVGGMCFADSDCGSGYTCTATTGVNIEKVPAVLPGLLQCPSPSDPGWTLVKSFSPGTSVAASWTDTGLSEDANYCYRIEATTGARSSRKLTAGVTTTLSSPANLSVNVSSITTGSMSLSWSSVTGPVAPGPPGQNGTSATSYTLGYNTDGTQTYTAIMTPTNCSGIGATSCTPSGLAAGTKYYFAVYDTDSYGNSSWSSQVNACTLPAAPAWNNSWNNTPFSDIETTSITVNWNGVTGATSYTLQYECLAPSGCTPSSWTNVPGCVGITGTSCVAASLTPGTEYNFQVNAAGCSGSSAPSTPVYTFSLPTAPTISSVTRSATCSDNNATITWNSVAEATGYNVEYSTCTDQNPNNCIGGYSWNNNWQPAGSTTQTTFTFLMNPGWAYQFRVSSTVNSGGTASAPSNDLGVWACLGTLTQNAVIPVSNTSLKPNWIDILGATNYDVQRKDCTGPCTGGTCTGGTYNTVSAGAGLAYNVNSFTDTGLTQGVSYSYIIRGYNTAVGGTNPDINDTFSSGINSTTWWQAGYLGSTPSTTPPINISDGNGSAAVASANGAVEFDTTSNGNDTSGANESQMGLNNLAPFAGDFDSQIDYNLPNGQVTSYSGLQGMNYYVDFRVDLSSDGKTRVAVQRHVDPAGNGYTAGVFVGDVPLNPGNITSYMPTSDTSGTLRISRSGSTVYAYVWTSGVWKLLAEATDPNLKGQPVRVYVFQNALRNNAISLKAQVDNFIATFPAITPNGLSSPPDVYSNAQCMMVPPPSPDPLTLSNVTSSQIQLSWQNNGGGLYTGYAIERSANVNDDPGGDGTAGNWGGYSQIATITNPATLTYTDTGLTAGYGYKYRARATYGSGSYTAYTSDTSSYVRTIPAVPAISGLTPNSTTQITANWNDVIGETGFNFYWRARSGSNDYCNNDCTQWSKAGVGECSNCYGGPKYVLSGLTEATTYCFAVAAINGSGSSACSNTGCTAGSTNCWRETTPLAPALNAPSGISTTGMSLNWSHVNNNAGYAIQRKTKSGGTYAQIGTTGTNVESYTDSGLDPGQVYYYQVYTLNGEGNPSAPSNEKYARTTPLAPSVTLSIASSSQITLLWPGVYGASDYNILRSTSIAGTYIQIAATSQPYQEGYCGQTYPFVGCATLSPMTASYNDTGLTEGTNYCYEVVAYNSGSDTEAAPSANSAPSSPECNYTSGIAAPSITGSHAVSCQAVEVDWTYSQSGYSGIDGISIEAQLNGIWSEIASISAPGGTGGAFIDKSGLNPGSTYNYRARVYRCEDLDKNPCACGAALCKTDYSAYSSVTSVATPAFSSGCNTCY